MTGDERPIFVVLVGATAAGKTDLAIEAAKRCSRPVEILGLDSRQLYRGVDVGTGKPDAAQRAAVAHHLLDEIDLQATPDAAWYRRRCAMVTRAVLERGHVPLWVGGSGFYLRALREGFFELKADPLERRRVREEIESLDDESLRARLRAVDPDSAERIHPHDRYRLGRALEIHLLSGRTATELYAAFRPRPLLGARFELVHLRPERRSLHRRIEARTRAWLAGGWVEEIEALLAAGTDPSAPGLQILGYRSLVQALVAGEDPRTRAEEIDVATRRYARQQETWFGKLPVIERSADPDRVRAALLGALERAGRRGLA